MPCLDLHFSVWSSVVSYTFYDLLLISSPCCVLLRFHVQVSFLFIFLFFFFLMLLLLAPSHKSSKHLLLIFPFVWSYFEGERVSQTWRLYPVRWERFLSRSSRLYCWHCYMVSATILGWGSDPWMTPGIRSPSSDLWTSRPTRSGWSHCDSACSDSGLRVPCLCRCVLSSMARFSPACLPPCFLPCRSLQWQGTWQCFIHRQKQTHISCRRLPNRLL